MLGARLVSEAARAYLQHHPVGYRYTRDDLLEIARQQAVLEAEATAESLGLVICDTDLLVMQVWWEEKYGALPDMLSSLRSGQPERAYLLMSPDLPWEPDVLRENPSGRNRLFLRYKTLLREGGHRFAVVKGEGEARLSSALEGIRLLFPDFEI